MRVRIILLALSFLLFSFPATSAIQPKPGKPCSKIGITQNFNGKKYTCIKKGKYLIWNNGIAEKTTILNANDSSKVLPTPTPSIANLPSPTVSQTSTNNSQSKTIEVTESYVTQERKRNNTGWAAAINSSLSAIWNEDYSSGYKAFRVKIISPQKDGISYDSGIIRDSAQSVTFFVSGTICNVIYASEFISYRDLEGEIIASKGRNQEQPRAEGGDCPAYGTKIIAGPMKQPDSGLRSVFSNISEDNKLELRFNGKQFKSYQVTLESQINDDVLWDSTIKNATGEKVQLSPISLRCDVRYGAHIKLWSENSGSGKLISDIRRHSFTSLPCPAAPAIGFSAPGEGVLCPQVGRTIDFKDGFLECRRVIENENKWTLVKDSVLLGDIEGNVKPIETCMLKDSRPPDPSNQNLNHSFPKPARFKPSTGTVGIVLAGIDFKDAIGEGKPFDQDKEVISNFNSWAEFYSGGKLKWDWSTLNEWIRVPGSSKQYNQKYSDEANSQMANEVFSALDKRISLSNVKIVLIIFPKQLEGTNDGYMPYKGVSVLTSAGNFSPYYWGGDPTGGQNLSVYYYHEVLHGIGFSLHAPSNGWFFGSTGATQDWQLGTRGDKSYGAPGYVDLWSGFVNGWYDEKNIVCMDKNSIINSHLKLESIDVNPKGRIGAMIKISDNEILVIESRRPSIYSIFPKGFAGITVTKVDTSKIYSRFDRSVDGFAWEKKQWSYYVRTDQQKSPEWIVSEQIPSRVLGYEGESFTIDGINISLKKSGKFDDISISISN